MFAVSHLGWPKMHQMWKTFRDSCSTRVFLQVDEKNALKHPKSWWLGVAPCSVVFSLIYLIDIRKNWQILVKVIFDPSSCLENMNKHRETTLHIQIPYSGPKEHQNLKNFWRIWEKVKKIDFQSTFIVRFGHFQTFNLFLLAKFSALCAPCEVFWWASSFLQVSGSFGHKKLEEIEKMAKNWFFRPHFKLSWSHQGVKNLI